MGNDDNRISVLQREHANLEAEIRELSKHAFKDEDRIRALKARRLKVRDELRVLGAPTLPQKHRARRQSRPAEEVAA